MPDLVYFCVTITIVPMNIRQHQTDCKGLLFKAAVKMKIKMKLSDRRRTLFRGVQMSSCGTTEE
jgi:hypothetical protein